MEEQDTWRKLLGRIIANPKERQRLANELNIRTITLTRWAGGNGAPRSYNLRQLLTALPEHRQEMHELLAKEFPEIVRTSEEEIPASTIAEIPSEFYTRCLQTCAIEPREQRFWALSALILQQALSQLDPNNLGMAITIAQCMPPSSGHKVRSLRERAGKGTHPWKADLEQEAIFLGSESLAGQAIAQSHLLAVEKRPEQQGGLYSGQWVKDEVSAAACPILQGGRFAGCLVVSSTQPGYFVPFRQTLITNYAALVALAFRPEDFYPFKEIELLSMPDAVVQKDFFKHLRQRMSTLMLESQRSKQPITIMEAEQIIWQQVEGELLAMQVRP
jgi:hypothetical protein